MASQTFKSLYIFIVIFIIIAIIIIVSIIFNTIFFYSVHRPIQREWPKDIGVALRYFRLLLRNVMQIISSGETEAQGLRRWNVACSWDSCYDTPAGCVTCRL